MTATIVLIIRVLIAACLYLFLGITVYTLWKQVRLAGERSGSPLIPEITLTYSDALEQSSVFNQPDITIGRDTSCELIIPDETVSSHHARLRYHHKQWWVEDLQSTNGTFLNDERLDTSTIMVSGDELILGNVSLQVEIKTLK